MCSGHQRICAQCTRVLWVAKFLSSNAAFNPDAESGKAYVELTKEAHHHEVKATMRYPWAAAGGGRNVFLGATFM